jgi:hypothetical protein
MKYRCMNGHEREYFPPWGLELDSQICWECGYTMEPICPSTNSETITDTQKNIS